MDALGPYGITSERLDEVSNQYRYPPGPGYVWKHVPACATAMLTDGKITGFKPFLKAIKESAWNNFFANSGDIPKKSVRELDTSVHMKQQFGQHREAKIAKFHQIAKWK